MIRPAASLVKGSRSCSVAPAVPQPARTGMRSDCSGLRDEHYIRQPIEMRIAGEQVRVVLQGGGVDDSIRRRELVLRPQFGGSQGDPCIERCDDAGPGKCDDPIRLVLRCIAEQATSPVQVGRLSGPANPRSSGISASIALPVGDAISHSIHADVSTRRIRSGLCGPDSSRQLAPLSDSRKLGSLRHRHKQHALPLRNEGKLLAGLPLLLVRTVFGIEIWNFADSVAVSAMILPGSNRSQCSKNIARRPWFVQLFEASVDVHGDAFRLP